LTTAVMNDGKKISGFIKRFRPKDGHLIMETGMGDEQKVMFRDAKSIITEDERVSVKRPCMDEDELKRARELGWNGD
jgi:hypothetical protein